VTSIKAELKGKLAFENLIVACWKPFIDATAVEKDNRVGTIWQSWKNL